MLDGKIQFKLQIEKIIRIVIELFVLLERHGMLERDIEQSYLTLYDCRLLVVTAGSSRSNDLPWLDGLTVSCRPIRDVHLVSEYLT